MAEAESFDEKRRDILSTVGVKNLGPYDYDDVEELDAEEQADQSEEVESSEDLDSAQEEEVFTQWAEQQEQETKEPEKDPTQAELDRVRQELQELRDQWSRQVEQSRQNFEPEEARKSAESEKVNWKDPVLVRTLAESLDLDDERAEQAAEVLGAMTEVQVARATEPVIKSAKEKEEAELANQRYAKLHQTLTQNAREALEEAKRNGGIEAQVVKDLETRGDRSILARRLRDNPTAFLTKGNLLNLVSSVAMEASRSGKRVPAATESTKTEGLVGSREEVTAAMSKASSASQSNQKLTPEQEIQAGILGVRNRRTKLPKFMTG